MSKAEIDQPPESVDEGSTEHQTFGVDEKKLVRKLDRHLVPLIMLLYTVSFLDR